MSSNAGNGVIEQDPNPEKAFFEKRFLRLAESDIHSDCEFIVGPKKTIIKGHKLIFSAASEVFDAMFYGLLKEDKPVRVEDLSAEGFEGMKTFIYTGEISFTSAINALSTYIAGRKYLIPQLSNVCTKFIKEKLQSSEVLEFCDICKSYKITKFEELCSRIIQEKTDEVVDSEYFISAESDTIELILKSPSLRLKSEIEVFDHFERWALSEVEHKKLSANEIASSFNHLKKHIRFLTIEGDEFVSRVEKSVLLTHEEKYAIAFNQIKLLSTPVPDSISLIQQPRGFNLPPSEFHQRSHSFTVPIEKANSSSGQYEIMDAPSGSSPLSVYWNYKYGFISFRVNTYYKNTKAMFIIKSKFRVLTVNKCDELVFENECNDFVDAPCATIQKQIFLVVIPISKLQNGRFLKCVNDQVVINIEGTFTVKKITL